MSQQLMEQAVMEQAVVERAVVERAVVERAVVERAVVEIDDGQGWTRICAYQDLQPGRGIAALLGTEQVAVFRTRDGAVHALSNRDPFSGAYVISRGLLGSRQGQPVVQSPMFKQAFDLRTGRCLDEAAAPDGSPADLRVWPVRLATAVMAASR